MWLLTEHNNETIQMITPSFSTTSTERVLPKLALDFTNASLDSRITFTRALNTATRVNSLGFIEAVNANQPRFDYNPITSVCKGLLIEEARTNVLTNSTNFSSTWTTFAASLSTGVVTSPDGSVSSIKFVESNTNAEHGIYQSTITSGSMAYSVYAKYNGRRYLLLRRDGVNASVCAFDLVNGVVTQETNCTGIIEQGPSGFYRCTQINTTIGNTVIKSSDVGTGSLATYAYQGDGISGFYLYGAQLEAGAFATSYIPTTTTALTRNADVATMTGTNFSDWYNASAGSFVAWLDCFASSGVGRSIVVDASGAAKLLLYKHSIDKAAVYDGTNLAITSASIATYPNKSKVAMGYNSTTQSVCVDGGAVASTNTTGFNLTGISLGNATIASTSLNGHISKLFYFKQKLTNSELIANSK